MRQSHVVPTTMEQVAEVDTKAWIRAVQVALVAAIALSLPSGVIAAFGFHAARGTTGRAVAVGFFAGFVVLLSTPWWQSTRSVQQRLTSTCLIWFGLTFTTHLTWELAWLLLRKQIIAAPDEPWAFMWWMYIEGGDRRYASDNPVVITIEMLSVANGVLGFAGLWLRHRLKDKSAIATLMLMATSVVHIYSALLYLLTESVGGYPNVDTHSFVDFWIKFWLLNGLWIVMPFVVWTWGWQTLQRQLRAA